MPKKNLTKEQKDRIIMSIYEYIFDHDFPYDRVTKKLPRGCWLQLETKYNLTIGHLHRVWKQYNQQKNLGISDHDFIRPIKKTRHDYNSKFTIDVQTSMDNIILENKNDVSYREMQLHLSENGIDLSLSTIFKYFQALGGYDEDSHVKPYLNEHNKMQRLQWVLDEIDISDPLQLKYYSQFDESCIDEKWNFVQRRKKHLKYLPDHPYQPNDTVIHKNHIEKLMFTVALSEPWEHSTGKRGIIFHAHQEPAQRNSINRRRGTLEWKPDNLDCEEFYNGQTKENGIINMIFDYYNCI